MQGFVIRSRGSASWVVVLVLMCAGCKGQLPLTPDDGYVFLVAGTNLYAAHKEELIARLVFRDRPGGCFVDVGAGNYRSGSTTYYLERWLGWKGFALERNARLGMAYLENRKHTRFYSVDVADKLNDPDVFWDGVEPIVSHTIDLDSLYDLLFSPQSPAMRFCHEIDYLSISVDGAERKVLGGASKMLRAVHPKLVRISTVNQRGGEVDDEARLMRHLGYVVAGYGSFDSHNSYYLRDETSPSNSPGVVRVDDHLHAHQ